MTLLESAILFSTHMPRSVIVSSSSRFGVRCLFLPTPFLWHFETTYAYIMPSS